MTTDLIIDDVVQRLIGSFDPLKIILFGSRARGDANPDSDWDFLVVMPDGTDRQAAAVGMLKRLADLPIAKDVVVTTPQDLDRRFDDVSSVLLPAMEEGKVLHERE